MILTVFPNSAAEKMGLEVGDVIKSINGVKIEDLTDLAYQMKPWIIDPVFEVENQFQGASQETDQLTREDSSPRHCPYAPSRARCVCPFKDGFLKNLWKQLQAKMRK